MEKRIHSKDVLETEVDVKTAAYFIDGKIYRKTFFGLTSPDTFITHTDCIMCGTEFKKRFTFDKMCASCSEKKSLERYLNREVADWDGVSYVYSDSHEKYFRDIEEIIEYMEEEEIESVIELRLFECKESRFAQVDIYSLQEDHVHEDWKPDDKLQSLVEELNRYLRDASTETYFPTKRRVDIKLFKVK